jgi:hypothetical protein
MSHITLFPGGPTFPKPLPDEIRLRFNALENALTIVNLGIDYPRYLKFMEVMPRVTRYLAYPRELRWRTSARPSLDTCLSCYDFVVESALQFQEMNIGKEAGQE